MCKDLEIIATLRRSTITAELVAKSISFMVIEMTYTFDHGEQFPLSYLTFPELDTGKNVFYK